jgi:hypothetical protein
LHLGFDALELATRRAFEEPAAPLGDLVGMDIELLRQLAQRLLAPAETNRFGEIAANANFALKAGVWFRRVRFVILAPDARLFSPLSGRKSTYRIFDSQAKGMSGMGSRPFSNRGVRRQPGYPHALKPRFRTIGSGLALAA